MASVLQIRTTVAPHTTVLTTYLRTRPSQPHQNAHAEREMLKFSSPPPPASVVETVQNMAIQQPEETNISPIIEEVLPPDPRVRPLIDQQTRTLEVDVRLMTVPEAENQETNE